MKTRILYIFLSVFFLQAGGEDRPRYGWPLAFDNGFSSTFMEFRSNHFHAGIDLCTNQQTGYPVLAIADGLIYQVRVVKNDTGLALYLRHADGNASIYFHLDHYNDALQAIVDRLRRERGIKYFGYYQLENAIPVKRGEVIAFSGETGSGFPHLHVEIRDPQGRALNPFQLLEFPQRDPYPPHPRGLLLKTRGASLVNGECGEIYIPLFKQNGDYTPGMPLRILGSFDPLLHVYDLTDCGKYTAPYAIRAFLDQKPVFALQLDRFAWEDNNQLGFVYDMFRSNANTFHFNLFWQPGFDLETTRVDLGQALEDLRPGAHELQLQVLDQFFNRSDVRVPFNKEMPEAVIDSSLKGASFPTPVQNLRQMPIDIYINHQDLILKLPGLYWPQEQAQAQLLQGGAGKIFSARTMKGGIFFVCRPQNQDANLDLRLQFFREQRLVGEIEKKMVAAVLAPEKVHSVALQQLRVDFAGRSVREPKLIWVHQAEGDFHNSGYPVLVAPFDLYPYDVPFLDDVFVRFQAPPDVDRPRQVGIFKYNFHGRFWGYVHTSAEGATFSARILTPGVYGLMRDIYPPDIRLLSRRRQAMASCQPFLVRIRDRGKGVDENSLRIMLNGTPIDCEYDPDWSWVKVFAPSGVLLSGENLLEVNVTDLAGNESSKKFSIILH